eukprot:15431242-Alexandrium_andersonii.AAC.1
MRDHEPLVGQARAAHAVLYSPAFCAAILRGIAAQHAREGRAVSSWLQNLFDAGRAVCPLGVAASSSSECLLGADRAVRPLGVAASPSSERPEAAR